MPEVRARGTERQTQRLEAFSDAVLAIAITLPVLELHVPHAHPGVDLLQAWASMWRDYLAFALSFLIIGIYWSHAHFGGKILEKTDHSYNLLTLLFLATITLVPIPLRTVALTMQDPNHGGAAALVCAFALGAPHASNMLMWRYALRAQLLDPRLTSDYLRRISRAHRLTMTAHAVAITIALFQPWLGLLLATLVTLVHVLPPSVPDYREGQAPADDIEEADERPRERS
jgi:uncharacterized membrane protein